MGLISVCVAEETKSNPPSVAEKLDIVGLKNVGKVAPGIFRGAQPAKEGLESLKKLGVKTIINLRHFHGEDEEKWCKLRGLDYVPILTATAKTPTDEHVKEFLEIVTDPKRQPVYFHCAHGQDRTGTMCAVFRMAVEGWSLNDALREMDAFGFHPMWRDLRNYVTSFPAREEKIWPKKTQENSAR